MSMDVLLSLKMKNDEKASSCRRLRAYRREASELPSRRGARLARGVKRERGKRLAEKQ
jgi:hypothetical protein